MPMEVYADESGVHDGSKRCVLAGFAGGRRKFILLEREWKKMLADFEIPADIGFHAKKFFKSGPNGERYGIYEGWSDDKVDSFIDKATSTIQTLDLHPVGAGIDVAHFNSLSHNLRRWLTGGRYDEARGKWLTSGSPNNPYFYAFQELAVSSAKFAKAGVAVDFILDRQDEFSGYALNMWNDLKSLDGFKTGTKLGGISFYSRFERVCLQAADMLAHCAYHADAYRRESERPEIAFAIHHFLKNEGGGVKKYDAEALELLIGGYPKALKEQDDEKARVRELRLGGEKDIVSSSSGTT